MYSAFNSSSETSDAIALAAAIFISSLISDARQSSAPRKMPGNAKTLLIWLGKSLLPVPTTAAPALIAKSGMISGTGFAIGSTIGFFAIEATISSVTIPGAETPMKMSAPCIASASVPVFLSGLVNSAIAFLAGLSLSSPLQIMPLLSHIITLFMPWLMSNFAMAMPAAPAPEKTAVQSSIFLSTTRRALITAAATTTAVPCWSS